MSSSSLSEPQSPSAVSSSEIAPSFSCPHTTVPDKNHTCDHPYHSQYSEGNLPPILFRLDPPSTREYGDIGLLEENGEVVRDYGGSPIRDFDFLPRYIAIWPSTWLLEYWMRTDGRLTYKDIKARMTAPPGEQPAENTLNMRRERYVRKRLGLSCWAARRGRTSRVSRVDLIRMERWTYDQIHMNTTMDIEYISRQGYSHPLPYRLRAKSLASGPTPPVYYPLDTFLGDESAHVPSQRVITAMETFFDVSEKALARGMDSWRHLPRGEIPVAWKPYKELPMPSSARVVDAEDEEYEVDNDDEDENEFDSGDEEYEDEEEDDKSQDQGSSYVLDSSE